MTRPLEQSADAPADDRLVLLRAPEDSFVSLDEWGPQRALPARPVMLQVQHRLAQRRLSRPLRFTSAGDALVIRGCDEERALDVVDVALCLGLTALDLAAREVTHPLRLGQERAVADAVQALRRADDSYLIAEGGPDLVFYVQVIHLDGEVVLEAVGREHVRRLPGVRLARLRLFGLQMPAEPRRNPFRRVSDDGAWVSGVVTHVMREVYGLADGAPLRLRTNGL